MRRAGSATLLVMVAAIAVAAPVEWDFPRVGNCHEGMPFSDGITGVLVWGGGDELRLTVGRADLWDHRGGYPWTAEQSYTNIVAAVRAQDGARLGALFRKETPKGEPRNPYMLPLGRVVVKLKGGATLRRGELDPFTGLGRLFLSNGSVIELAMSKQSRCFAMRFPQGTAYESKAVSCMEFPQVKAALEPIGFKLPRMRADGFDWGLPADCPVSIDFAANDAELWLSTHRAERTAHPSAVAKGIGFAGLREQMVRQWAAFWEKSARVHVPDPVIQRVFDYGMYRFGAMTDPDGVPPGLQGPWLEDDKLIPWNGDYHFNINVQECYSPAYRGGHFEHLMPLFKMVLSWRPRLRENAKKFVGIDNGYSLPHSVDDRGVCIGGFWTGTIDHGSTAWVAAMMCRYVKYSGDVAFLEESAYDFMKGAMNVYLAMMEDRNGALALPLGPSPEWKGSDMRRAVGRNPSFQLAACHRLAQDLLFAAAKLGVEPDPRWLDVERRLPAFSRVDPANVDEAVWFGATGPGFGIFEGAGLTESHRHHSHMAGIYPFDTIPRGNGEHRELIDGTYANWVLRGTGLWTGWCVPWASILHVDAGNSAAAVSMLRLWDDYFCDEGHGSHHNAVFDGFTNFRHGRNEMQMDGQCAAATAVMELMAHEINGRTEFFRGCPPEWKDVSFENLALSDGRRVSGRRVAGNVSIVQEN